MKINLSSHVVAQVVGDDLLLLDSTTQGVYSLALADVVDHSEGFRSLTVSEAAESVAVSLCEQGLATAESAGLSRRALVGSGSAVVGAGLLALSLPTAAAASSAGGGSSQGTVTPGNFTVNFPRAEPGDPPITEFFILVDGDLSAATNVTLTHTFPSTYLNDPSPSPVRTNFAFPGNRSQFSYQALSEGRPPPPWSVTFSYELNGVLESSTTTVT